MENSFDVKNTRPIFRALFIGFALLASSAGRLLSTQELPGKIRKEASVMVPMRDGVRLSTDLYFPIGDEGPFSTIMIRTPYGKTREYPYGGIVPLFVEAGYVVAYQDTRGRFESEGRYTVRFSDREDGYDALSWIVSQPWSNEKVATFGCSYRGETQIVLAAERHPNHVTAFPMAPAAGFDPGGRPWTSFDGGAFELAQTAGWFVQNGSKVFYGPPSWVNRQEWFRSAASRLFNMIPDRSTADLLDLYRTLPLVDVVDKAGTPPTDYKDYVSNTPDSEYFRSLDFVRKSDRFDIPAVYVDSWYDFGVAETLQLFNQMREQSVSQEARDHQYVIITPSTHCAWTRAAVPTRAGARDVGDWQIDFNDMYLRWFAYWLDGEENGITEMPRVQYYLMGANEWRSSEEWPVQGTSYENLYFHSGGAANSLSGDGSLSMRSPGHEPPDHFEYNPADPVPSLGGQACCTGMNTGAGSYDQSQIEMRPDVLVYTSPPLEEGLEVTGPLEAVLYVSSEAPDTDFTVKLVDVYPDGTAYNIQEAAKRMRYREGLSTAIFMEPGEVYEIWVNLHATSNYFGPGHRIRVEVSSSNFPRWSRNLNTRGNNYDETEWVVTQNTIHHSEKYPSRLLLPVVR